MTCSKCGSENVSIQMVQDMKLKKKHHGIFYWLFFGWLIDMMLWIFLTIPMLIIKIFRGKKQKLVTKQRKMAICQNCGNQWQLAK